MQDYIGQRPFQFHASLQRLKLSNMRWVAPPLSFSGLTQLHHLQLESNDSLEGLPNDFAMLSHLTFLGLDRFTRLTHFPTALRGLSNLQHLELKSCDKLQSLSDSIEQLQQLTHITLGHPITDILTEPDQTSDTQPQPEVSYRDAQALPRSIYHLPNLRVLRLMCCY